jgi:putative membrane protein insertion efficiency factor
MNSVANTAPLMAAKNRSARLRSLPKLGVLGLISVYQNTIGPALPPVCRFQPTCSTYAYTAIARYGALRGGFLAGRRLARCHPFGGHGYDPVP